MAIRALYEAPDPTGSIDIRNPGFGFVAAVDTTTALAAGATFELTDELEFEVVQTATQNTELANPGINPDVLQRVTVIQQEPAA